jgi:hypothetical protein
MVLIVVLLSVFGMLFLRFVISVGMVLLPCVNSGFLGKVKWCTFDECQN